MAESDTPRYTFEELKEKASLALADPKLVEIVKNAPLNSKGKVNLSWVEREARQYVLKETNNQQQVNEMAKSTRFLAMIRRDYQEELGKLLERVREFKQLTSDVDGELNRITSEVERAVRETEGEPPRKNFCRMEFQIPWAAELITRAKAMPGQYGGTKVTRSLTFEGVGEAWGFCRGILVGISESKDFSVESGLTDIYGRHLSGSIKRGLAQLLEERFGMKVVDAEESPG